VNKVSVTKGIPILVVTHVPMRGDVRENHISTSTTSSTFVNANVDNIQRLFQQNEEKEEKSEELEEKLQQVKLDERSLKCFKVSVEEVRIELEGAIIDMYSHVHLFQDAVAIIIE
jgi:hypothetical protein